MQFNQTISSKYSKKNKKNFLNQIIFNYINLLQTILQQTTLISYILTTKTSIKKNLQNITQFI